MSYKVELHIVKIIQHIGNYHVLLMGSNDEINFAKVVTSHDIDVNYVLFEWQDKCGIATGLEVNFYDLISFIVNILVHWNENLV